MYRWIKKKFMKDDTKPKTSDNVKPEEKEIRMFQFKSNVELLDRENAHLLQASNILESITNEPGLSSDEFMIGLINTGVPPELYKTLTLAAISIETMMALDLTSDFDEEPTIH